MRPALGNRTRRSLVAALVPFVAVAVAGADGVEVECQQVSTQSD